MMHVLLLLMSVVFLAGTTMRFQPRGEKQRLAAIGPTKGLPEPLRQALTPGDDFEPIPEAGPSDWLANHPEEGQTFEQFRRSNPQRPDKKRSKLYLQPLGDFDPEASAILGGRTDSESEKKQGPSLERLREFAAAFFMMDVAVLPPLDITQARITTRRNPYAGSTQLLTGDILRLLRTKLPDDAFALLGVTMVDLYPDESWNFVFGQASLSHRVGVYSFARYDPRFYGEVAPSRSERPPDARRGGGLTADEQNLMLRRSCKVLAHELGHMFGVQHCIYFHCLMNGSNYLAESDARPLHLCPVDLRKLQHGIGFDVVARYRRLRDFCKDAGFADEAGWLMKRLGCIASAKKP